MGWPALATGKVVRLMLRRGLPSSTTRQKSLGKGSMQLSSTSGSHAQSTSCARAHSPASAASRGAHRRGEYSILSSRVKGGGVAFYRCPTPSPISCAAGLVNRKRALVGKVELVRFL